MAEPITIEDARARIISLLEDLAEQGFRIDELGVKWIAVGTTRNPDAAKVLHLETNAALTRVVKEKV